MVARGTKTTMQPLRATTRKQPQKRERDESPVTPLKRRRTQLSPTGSSKTPASAQIEYTATPLSGLRTREQLDRYYENVKRDEQRILEVKSKLGILRGEMDAEPESSPEESSESTSIGTKKAIKLMEKIVANSQLIEDLEEERRLVPPKPRGPTRVNQDGVAKSRKKEKTQREKLRDNIRASRRRIAYAWDILASAGIVNEPELDSSNNRNVNADNTPSRIPSPDRSARLARQARTSARDLVEKPNNEPVLPTGGRPIARSTKSSVSPEQSPPDTNPVLGPETAREQSPVEKNAKQSQLEQRGKRALSARLKRPKVALSQR